MAILTRSELLLVLLLCTSDVVDSDTWSVASANYEVLYQWYDNSGVPITDIIPQQDLTVALNINLSMSLDSINGFDAVSGNLEISGSLGMEWTDQMKTLSSSDFTITTENTLLIDHDKAWSPSLVMLNAVDTVKKIGQTSNTDTTYKMQYNIITEKMAWQPRVILNAACTPDVTYYPFDRQKCHFTYTNWGYLSTEISLSTSGSWDLSQFSKSGVWSVKSTSSSTYQSGGSTYAKFEIEIEREPLFFTFNIFLPVLILGLLNGFVFLLPANSGERIGFCITCFLSFVVLLQTTMEFLPEISNPMSLLSYYIIMMMIFSSFINILTILLLRIYHSPPKDKVPNWIKKPVQVFTCVICNAEKREEDMEWPTVGRLLDIIFFFCFLAVQSVFSVFFIIPVAVN